MPKIRLAILLVMLTILSGTPAFALFWQDAPLVTINEQSLTIEDYQNWWREWKEPQSPLPESPDDYIDWVLLSNEAEQMQLYDEPSFKQKVDTFLKVRSLMMLKQEEVDDKITIGDDEIEQIYRRDYTPLIKLRSIELTSKQQCDTFLAAAKRGNSTEQIFEDPQWQDLEQPVSEPVVQRPNQLPAHIRKGYEQRGSERYLAPYSYNDRWFIIEIMEQDPGNDNDMANVAEPIIYRLRKQRQAELTGQLNLKLMKKYQVQLNQDVIGRIHEQGPDEEVADQAAITFPDLTITAQILFVNASNHYKRFGGKNLKDTSFEDIVQRVANDIIAQTVTTMEALNRDYETRPPFDSVYYFYQRHRLIRELEKALIHPYTEVTEEELHSYYQSHLEDYAFPVRVSYESVETRNEKMALQLRDQLRQGREFDQILAPLAPGGIEKKTTPLAHLIPEMQELVAQLRPGQSDMLQVDDRYHFIRLLEEPKVDHKPFDQVHDSLKAQLSDEKFNQRRASLIAQLRERASISVNERQWQRCINQLKGQ
ncbi:MAG: hypothetical protein C0620_03000 [Desulfuromonas sp.]|nr:MAG: hypothetical protein C0620_03000 [Desulfuromonas sp.]